MEARKSGPESGTRCSRLILKLLSLHPLVALADRAYNLIARDRGLDVAHVERGLVRILF